MNLSEEPDAGNPTVRDEKGACGNVMHGLASFCHEAGNDGNNGRRFPKHARTVFLPEQPDVAKETGLLDSNKSN